MASIYNIRFFNRHTDFCLACENTCYNFAMKSYSLIIADVHLHPDDTHPINHAFYAFLDTEASQADALYILGDLFEMWVGDDIGLEQYKTVVKLFAELTSSGLPIYLLFGNRDFLMRKAFWQATGINPIYEPYPLTLHGHKLLMLHGDSLCTDDKDYQRARKVLRNPVVMWLFLNFQPTPNDFWSNESSLFLLKK